MSKWQPIETAPKDGTEILVCTMNLEGRSEMAVVWAGSFQFETCWFVTDDQEFSEPTHWMPLPSPPGTNEG